jgi:outer membrane protein assembly factor BamB
MMEIGYSTKDGRELWHLNRTVPYDGGMIQWVTSQGGVGDGVYVEWYQEKMVWYGYNIKTGNKLWGPTEPYANGWGMYGWQARLAYGMLLANDFSGQMHAFDLQTGENVWNYDTGAAGYDTPYGIYPSETPVFMADGKIYISHGHGYSPPIFKGATLDCINATDGTLIWDVLSFNNRAGFAIADGYLACYNIYDGQVYSFGKGPSVTTVEAPKTAVTVGSSMIIEGTVLDTCAGAQDLVAQGKFKSVGAVSDASQAQWMGYLYMQQLCPANTTGVEVQLDSFDPNGNFVPIGTATTTLTGKFSYTWEPPIPGTYTIRATFKGTKSYGTSYEETTLVAVEAPQTQTPETPPTPPDNTPYVIGMGVAIIVAIAIVGVVLALILRKRP